MPIVSVLKRKGAPERPSSPPPRDAAASASAAASAAATEPTPPATKKAKAAHPPGCTPEQRAEAELEQARGGKPFMCKGCLGLVNPRLIVNPASFQAQMCNFCTLEKSAVAPSEKVECKDDPDEEDDDEEKEESIEEARGAFLKKNGGKDAFTCECCRRPASIAELKEPDACKKRVCNTCEPLVAAEEAGLVPFYYKGERSCKGCFVFELNGACLSGTSFQHMRCDRCDPPRDGKHKGVALCRVCKLPRKTCHEARDGLAQVCFTCRHECGECETVFEEEPAAFYVVEGVRCCRACFDKACTCEQCEEEGDEPLAFNDADGRRLCDACTVDANEDEDEDEEMEDESESEEDEEEDDSDRSPKLFDDMVEAKRRKKKKKKKKGSTFIDDEAEEASSDEEEEEEEEEEDTTRLDRIALSKAEADALKARFALILDRKTHTSRAEQEEIVRFFDRLEHNIYVLDAIPDESDEEEEEEKEGPPIAHNEFYACGGCNARIYLSPFDPKTSYMEADVPSGCSCSGLCLECDPDGKNDKWPRFSGKAAPDAPASAAAAEERKLVGHCHECNCEVFANDGSKARFVYREFDLCIGCDAKAEDDECDVDPTDPNAQPCALCTSDESKPVLKLTCKPPKFPSAQPDAGVCFTCRHTCTDPEHDGEEYNPSTELVDTDPKTGKPICAACAKGVQAAAKLTEKKALKKTRKEAASSSAAAAASSSN